jgi:hypothetical protein
VDQVLQTSSQVLFNPNRGFFLTPAARLFLTQPAGSQPLRRGQQHSRDGGNTTAIEQASSRLTAVGQGLAVMGRWRGCHVDLPTGTTIQHRVAGQAQQGELLGLKETRGFWVKRVREGGREHTDGNARSVKASALTQSRADRRVGWETIATI